MLLGTRASLLVSKGTTTRTIFTTKNALTCECVLFGVQSHGRMERCSEWIEKCSPNRLLPLGDDLQKHEEKKVKERPKNRVEDKKHETIRIYTDI